MIASLALVVAIGLSAGWAQSPPSAVTAITVPDMHCMGCAKKMAAQLNAVSGVGKVEVNLPATAMVVSAKAGTSPSPRGMWEAIEKAGYKPAKLEGPSGTFTSKPQS
jgi:Cu+-exporting ATPase